MLETPSQLPYPSFVMNFPFSLSTEVPNNFMTQRHTEEERILDRPKAYQQFMSLYNFAATESLIYLLPSHQNLYQDLPYIANLGIYLPHIIDRNIILLSNFASEPRQGEETVGKPFFELMNYETINCPYKWEGEADLKYLYDNIYIGGYGIRSEIKAYEWMEANFGMKIIKLKMDNPAYLHLDCTIFPMTKTKTLVSYPTAYNNQELLEISKVTEIIDVYYNFKYPDTVARVCNSCLIGNKVLTASRLPDVPKNYYSNIEGGNLWEIETEKMSFLKHICDKIGVEGRIFNISEFEKSGALLSCMFMHLNYWKD